MTTTAAMLRSVVSVCICALLSSAAAAEQLTGAAAAERSYVRALEQKLELLSARLATLEARGPVLKYGCSSFPNVTDSMTMSYSGCNSNVLRNTTETVQTCQNGTVFFENTASMTETGLFGVKIAVNDPAHDVYHFVCTFTKDVPHTAQCTLTYEEPARPEGPAWLNIRFNKVNMPDCVPGAATIVGTYFYDALTNAAGVYSFYAKPN